MDHERQRKRSRRRMREPWKELSFLFNKPVALESDCLEKGLNGWQSTLRLEVSGALSTALENPMEWTSFMPGRTHNRIRSPR